MPYILPDSFLAKLEALDEAYEKEAKVKLDQAPPSRFSIWSGAKDIKTRKAQIYFIQDWLKLLRFNLFSSGHFPNRDAKIEHLRSLRLLVAVCIYIKSTLEGNWDSALEIVINKALELQDNPLDEITKSDCLSTAQEYLSNHLDLKNLEHHYGVKFNHELYAAFRAFIDKECQASLEKSESSSYKVTSTLVPLFSISFELVGNSVGYVLGDSLGHCIPLSSSQSAAAAGLATGALYLTGSSINPCLLLLGTPTMAKCINSVCGVSAAYAGGKFMGLIGIAVACAIGLPIDLTADAMHLIYESLPSMEKKEYPFLVGYCLADSSRVIGPIRFQFLKEGAPELELNPGCQNHHVIAEIKDQDISIKIDGKPLEMEDYLKEDLLRNLAEARSSSLSAKKPLSLSEQETPFSSMNL